MNKFLIMILVIVVISGCQDNESTIVISFDTEYPYGVGFPESFTEQQKQDYKPNRENWEATVKEISKIGVRNNVRFQFNIVGKTAEDSLELVKELEKNHDISCHSYSHKNQLDLDYEGKFSELNECKKAIKRVLGREIIGNRFPYTKYDKDSLKALKELGYKWDSSIWKDKASLKPYDEQDIMEYPINPASDDWAYFIMNENSDAKGFFELLEKDIKSLDKESVYVIILHPWVLSLDKDRVRELDRFVKRHKNIRSIDEIHNSFKY